MSRTPYVYAVVTLDAGVRLPTTIVGCAPEAVEIDLPVQPVFESVGDGAALLFFRPARR
jgi:hypothetical protein